MYYCIYPQATVKGITSRHMVDKELPPIFQPHRAKKRRVSRKYTVYRTGASKKENCGFCWARLQQVRTKGANCRSRLNRYQTYVSKVNFFTLSSAMGGLSGKGDLYLLEWQTTLRADSVQGLLRAVWKSF